MREGRAERETQRRSIRKGRPEGIEALPAVGRS